MWVSVQSIYWDKKKKRWDKLGTLVDEICPKKRDWKRFEELKKLIEL